MCNVHDASMHYSIRQTLRLLSAGDSHSAPPRHVYHPPPPSPPHPPPRETLVKLIKPPPSRGIRPDAPQCSSEQPPTLQPTLPVLGTLAAKTTQASPKPTPSRRKGDLKRERGKRRGTQKTRYKQVHMTCSFYSGGWGVWV